MAERRPVKIDSVYFEGDQGQFRADDKQIGWKRADGAKVVVRASALLQRAEWCEGHLRMLCAVEDGEGNEVLAFKGFAASDYDKLWRHFQETWNVYIKKHNATVNLDGSDFDSACHSLEDAADRVDEAPRATVLKKSREVDLLKKVESMRDGLEQAISGDKQALSRVFAAQNCERIGRLRLVIDTVQLEVYQTDERWLHLRRMADAIESVLREMGTFRQWKPSETAEHASLARRMMVYELQRRQGGHAEDLPMPSVGNAQDTAQLEHERKAGRASGYGGGVDEAAASMFLAGLKPRVASGVEDPLASRTGAAADADEGSDDNEAEEAVADPRGRLPSDFAEADPQKGSSASTDAAEGEERRRRRRGNDPDTLMEGWVWKRSRHLKLWRRRWLVLNNEYLVSYKTRSDSAPTEIITAGSVLRVSSADAETQQSKSFCVVTARRSYFMVSDDNAQRDEWVSLVDKTLSARRNMA
eukprot:gnl/TRDRNA2_/TRDRNA2_188196_c0_seq1.p1 gnl/TRDRNA2_/TRDRNA2_188196_c0~~gnl/TRDRNA2_/TRDRNA2_188196_c0_seq1.p1  ORF type:complete len:472 (-),score=116.14 gnl/TRDRNA2_/TRDRNA2_188196_c0_seq1:59-1474(-)